MALNGMAVCKPMSLRSNSRYEWTDVYARFEAEGIERCVKMRFEGQSGIDLWFGANCAGGVPDRVLRDLCPA